MGKRWQRGPGAVFASVVSFALWLLSPGSSCFSVAQHDGMSWPSLAVLRPPASCWRLSALSQAHALGHLGTLPGVGRRGHGIVGLEPEQLAIRLRRQLVRDVEMAPKNFLLLAADQADEVIVPDRPADGHGGLRFGLGMLLTERIERARNRADQIAQVGRSDGVPGDVGDDDLRCELGDRPRLLLFWFFNTLRHGSASA
jgi:hypothetical protein